MPYTALPTPVRITEHDWPKDTIPLLTIYCTTYQHVHFIKETINGILVQETTFPVQILIHDDASKDGTAEIVKHYQNKYPKLIHAILQSENQYSQGIKAGKFLKPLIKGKYIAICEGDDYWTSPQKLEKQVNYLEENPSVVLSFHDVKSVDEKNNPISESKIKKLKGDHQPLHLKTFNQIVSALIPTLSIIYRNISIPSPRQSRKIKNEDTFLFAMLSAYGEMHNIGETMGAHRLHQGGVWTSTPLEARALDLLNTSAAIAMATPNIHALPASKELGRRAAKCSLDNLIHGDYRTTTKCIVEYFRAFKTCCRYMNYKNHGFLDILITQLQIATFPPRLLISRIERKFRNLNH